MSAESGMTPEQARAALDQAAAAEVATPADRARLQRGLVAIGIGVGALIVAMRLTIGNVDAPTALRQGGFAIAMALYVAVIVYAVVTMRRAKAAPRGFSSRYVVGIALSFLIYIGYVVVQAGAVDSGIPWIWTGIAALAAVAPSFLAAQSIAKLAVR